MPTTSPIDTSPTVSSPDFWVARRLPKNTRTLGEQGAWIHTDGDVYQAQAKPGTGDAETSFYHRLTSVDGKLRRTATLELVNGGHATTFFMVDVNGKPHVVANFNKTTADGSLIARGLALVRHVNGRVEWTDPVVRWLPIRSNRYAVPSLSPDERLLFLRETTAKGDIFRVLDWPSVLADDPQVLAEFGPIETSSRAFQGIAIASLPAKRCWVLYGHTNGGARHRSGNFDPYAVDEHQWDSFTAVRPVDTHNYQPKILDWQATVDTEPGGLQCRSDGLYGGSKVDDGSDRWFAVLGLARARTLVISGKAYPPIREVSVWWVNNARTEKVFSRHVYHVQRWLNASGACRPPIAEDGLWGPATQAGVDAFRRQVMRLRGSDTTGSVGPASLTALRDAAKASLPIRTDK